MKQGGRQRDFEDSGLGTGVLPLALRGQLDAISRFLLALLLLLVVGSVTQRFRPGPLGMAVTEVLAILLPALLWSRLAQGRSAGAEPRRDGAPQVLTTLRLVPPSFGRALRLLAGGALCGVALFLVLAVWFEPLFERMIPVPPAERAALLSLLRPPSGLRPLSLDLVCFALVPAACEEILFRGAILTGLRGYARPGDGRDPAGAGDAAQTPLGRWSALVVCALLFGAFHRSFAKFLPTSALGLGFGAVAVYSGSLWPAIAMHAVNNTLVVLLVRAGQDDAAFSPISGPGFLCVVLAAALGLLGVRLLRPERLANR